MSVPDAVDGSPLRLQPTLQPLKKEESDGADQDGRVGYRQVDYPLGGKLKEAKALLDDLV